MQTIALCAIALALLVMAGMDVYQSQDMVCARQRDRAMANVPDEPMNRGRYRVYPTEKNKKPENFDEAYQKYLEAYRGLRDGFSAIVEEKYAECRGDWQLK